MKKRLFSILTILGIGCSFCSALDSCTQNYNYQDTYCYTTWGSSCDKYANYFLGSYEFKESGVYSITSFGAYNYLGRRRNSSMSLYVCYSNETGSIYFPGHLDDYSCSPITYTLTNPNGNYYNFNLITPVDFDSTVYKYLIFTVVNFQNDIEDSRYSSSSPFYYQLDDNVSFIPVTSNGTYFVPTNICYSSSSGPKFKVNYGNTSYEYELDSDLSIYLKSPVIQNGNTFSYAGSTGINLFYNGLTQFYNKSNLYLDSNYRYNNNIFTPICN